VSEAQLDQLRAKGWEVRYTSAKTGEAVEDAFNTLAGRMLGKST